jgi:DNA-binding Lrp family transcriptional regulator
MRHDESSTAARRAKERFGDRSDRAIADMVGVSPSTVGAHRKKWEEAGVQFGQPKARIGKDGKRYKPSKTVPTNRAARSDKIVLRRPLRGDDESGESSKAAPAAIKKPPSKQEANQSAMEAELAEIKELTEALYRRCCATLTKFPTTNKKLGRRLAWFMERMDKVLYRVRGVSVTGH